MSHITAAQYAALHKPLSVPTPTGKPVIPTEHGSFAIWSTPRPGAATASDNIRDFTIFPKDTAATDPLILNGIAPRNDLVLLGVNPSEPGLGMTVRPFWAFHQTGNDARLRTAFATDLADLAGCWITDIVKGVFQSVAKDTAVREQMTNDSNHPDPGKRNLFDQNIAVLAAELALLGCRDPLLVILGTGYDSFTPGIDLAAHRGVLVDAPRLPALQKAIGDYSLTYAHHYSWQTTSQAFHDQFVPAVRSAWDAHNRKDHP